MAGLVEAERAATAADVAGAYRVLLGRDVESAAVLREKVGQPLGPMLADLVASDEFVEGVVPALIDAHALGERFGGMPLPCDAAWVRNAPAVTPETGAAAGAAETWRDLLLALYADPRFGPALDVAEITWDRRRLVAGLRAWEPRRPDAGSLDDDWGETVAEREAAMKRDAAERLRLDPASAPPAATEPAGAEPPLITVLTPVYDPPLEFLARAIDSVRSQSFSGWELVLVDDGSTRPTVRSLLQAYAALDPRIRVVLQTENGGISRASNAGLALARGRWLALLDNDDMLMRDALEHVAAAVAARPDADLLYSDEVFIGEDDAPQELFPKPDWSPLLMLNGHYIGHLTVHRTQRVRELGGFRPAYDFSQDYDLALRVTDGEPVVVHLDRILYGWRRLEGSAAAGGKAFARRGNVAALQDALDRRGWGGFAEALPTANRARRHVSPPPPVAIVVPSDSAENITAAVRSITERTWYEAYEIHVVTTSALAARLRAMLSHPRLRWVPYDRPFNFSDKCDEGARAAREAGARFVCFFNDDVRVITPDWIEALLEVATLPGVGAVAPKLVYEDGRVQHAGMVTGVRRLVGTAFHMRPADSHAWQNLGVQSVREVSLLCAALILLPLEAFDSVDGFDAVDFPIAHSDVDLCLRLREAGWSLVYTPHAVLEHIGHVSLGAEEAAASEGVGAHAQADARRRAKDKADVALLRRFPQALARDPFFPPPVRGLHHLDSEARFHLHPAAGARRERGAGPDVLILSNELTGTGAPKIVLDMTEALLDAGAFVTVASRRDGSMRGRITAAGATVIVDSALFDAGDALRDLGRGFDVVIANTAVTWPCVARLASLTDVRWYFHEVEQVHRLADEQPGFAAALRLAGGLWAGSALAAEALARHGVEARVLPYGVDDRGPLPPRGVGPLRAPVRVGVFGTYERRKGQDLALAAWRLLPPELRDGAELHMWGRVLEAPLHAELLAAAAREPDVALHGELGHADYMGALAGCDIVWVPSRDDAMPLVSLDALSAGRVLACSLRVGTAAHLQAGVSGLVARAPEPQLLAAALAPALADAGLRARVGAAGRAVFEREFTHAAFRGRLLRALDLPAPAVPAAAAARPPP